MQPFAFSGSRQAALAAVHCGDVRYHHGLTGPALGFTWSENRGGQMFHEMRHALHELWAANLIDVETHRVFARSGHRVVTTMRGYQLWREWHDQARTADQDGAPAPGEQGNVPRDGRRAA